MLRNGFYLPKYKSSIVTEKYLMRVISGELWCPMFAEIKLKPCPKRPYKKILMDKLVEVATEHGFELGIDSKYQPDKDWIIAVLSTYKADDVIFDKYYVPPPRPNK